MSLLSLFSNSLPYGHYPDELQKQALILLEKYSDYLNKHEKHFGIVQNLKAIIKKSLLSDYGLYIFGGVGRGKSVIMTVFYNSVNHSKKIKLHFYEFMHGIHIKIHEGYSIKQIAKGYKGCLICLDELQINNIADAMLIKNIFEALHEYKAWVIVTSNRAPEDLYENGLQRDLFLPFIDYVRQYFEVYELNGSTDYRTMGHVAENNNYLCPINDLTQRRLSKILDKYINWGIRTINIGQSRAFKVLRCCNDAAVFDFTELCDDNLGYLDYNALCETFSLIVVLGIPKLEKQDYNKAVRFITLIDCIYEHRNSVKIICTADVCPKNIYLSGKHSFEFARTVSRLNELCGFALN